MTKHADASPSAASIWLICPASVTLARGRPRKASVYTREGSAAHEVADRMFHGIPVPDEMDIEGETVEIDEEMVEHVETYLQVIGKIRETAWEWKTEFKVTISGMAEPISGTTDFAAWSDTALSVVDLKYGKGVAVSATDNPQLWIYALGALEARPEYRRIERVHMTVVQPRGTTAVDTQTVMVEELLRFKRVVLEPALDRIARDDPSEYPGPHCRWCVRAGVCRALAERAQKDAKMAFEKDVIQAVHGMTNDELADILDKELQIKAWLEWVRTEATSRVDVGQEIPRYKLVAKRAVRKWIDEGIVGAILKKILPVDEYTKIVSPAQVEKALKRVHIPKLPANIQAQVDKTSSGTTLVREEDAREGLKNDPKSVFKKSLKETFLESF